MWIDWLFIALGLVLLYYGAEGLVRGSASLAARLGLSPLLIGLTVVAFGTSMPELLVSVQAALGGNSEVAVGNVVGSNIFNIGVILALAAIIQPLKVQFQLIRFDVPVMLAVVLLANFLLMNRVVTRGNGMFLVSLLIVYIGFSIWIARRSKTEEVEAEYVESLPPKTRGAWFDVVLIIGGFLGLAFGARCLVDGSVAIARTWGVSEAVIGLTIVAAGTSMPELAASIVAAAKKEGDIAVGNIVGSNIFNVLCILGISSIIHPLHAPGVTSLDLWVMVGLAVIVLPLMRTDFVLKRWEGILLLSIYGVYLGAMLWSLQ